jgi:DNA repair and recombination protein RAD54 and RAD54-like protein
VDFSVPIKYEHVVFCTPSALQVSLYQLFTSSDEIQTLLRGTGSQPLKAIDMLRKLCNTPQLLNLPEALHGSEGLLPGGFVGATGDKSAAGQSRTASRSRAVNGYGGGSANHVHPEYSGKFAVLERYVI